MRLYLIRHAQSVNNALRDERDRLQDPPLTELGERQAEALARHLAAGIELDPALFWEGGPPPRGYGFTRMYCSPMWRSLQTAAPVAQALDLTPQVWIDVHEQGGIYLDHADGRGRVGYSGKTRREIAAVFPSYLLPEGIGERGWWNRDFEEWPACYERATKVAEELRGWVASDECIAMISHGGFLDALLKVLFNQTSNRRMFYYHYNTAISRVDFRSDGFLEFRYLNRVSHLSPDLVS